MPKPNSALATYLHDHLGAANFAMELLEKWRSADEPEAKRFAAELFSQIKRDRAQLRHVIRAVGSASHSLKEVAGWVAEKATRWKLGAASGDKLALCEGLEVLVLGIAGKRALWRMLHVLARTHLELCRFDFSALIRSARLQQTRVEKWRLSVGAVALAGER